MLYRKMKLSDFKVGQTVCIVTEASCGKPDYFDRVEKAKVTKVGRKYLHAGIYVFDATSNFSCIEDYGKPRRLYYCLQDLVDEWNWEFYTGEIIAELKSRNSVFSLEEIKELAESKGYRSDYFLGTKVARLSKEFGEVVK